MRLCAECSRHVLHAESSCPFCGAELREARSPLHPAGMIGVVLAMSAACSSHKVGDGGSTGNMGDGATEATDGADTTTSGSGAGTTTADTGMTATGTATTDSDSETGDDPCAFYAGCPDVGEHPCNLFEQDCPASQKCIPAAEFGETEPAYTICTPIEPDPNNVGEPCTVETQPYSGHDDCNAVSYCAHVDPDTLEGICVEMCTGTPSDPMCSQPDEACLSSDFTAACYPECNSTDPACPDGESCVETGVGGASVCAPSS